MIINLTLNMYVKSVQVSDNCISFGIPINNEDKSAVIWLNFICVGVAFGKLKERGIQSGDKVNILKAFPKVNQTGKLIWLVTDVQ